MKKIKTWLKERVVNLKLLLMTLWKALLAFPVDGILAGLSVLGALITTITGNMFSAFVCAVLAMHCGYTAYRLNGVIKKK